MKIEIGLKYKIVNSSEIGPKIGTVHDIRNGIVSVYFGSNPNDVGSDYLYSFIEKIEKGELIVINNEPEIIDYSYLILFIKQLET
jgi:hypothetical protein